MMMNVIRKQDPSSMELTLDWFIYQGTDLNDLPLFKSLTKLFSVIEVDVGSEIVGVD